MKWMKFKKGVKRGLAPGKFKGVRATSDAIDVVWTMPKRLLLNRK